MKKIILLSLTIGLFTIQSCSDKNAQTDIQAQTQTSLAGQVYGWTNPPLDTTKCEQVLQSNNSFPKLLFIDDSTFIKAFPASCGDLGTCTRYYIGKYKIDDQALLLTFNPKMVVYHMKSKNLLSPYVELENSDFSKERLVRRDCKNILFFEECDTQGSLMTPKADTLANDIKFLKSKNILDKLFEIK